MRSAFETFMRVAEFLGGSREEPPAPWWPRRHPAVLWGLWWSLLLFVIILFCGQSSRFIYIDF